MTVTIGQLDLFYQEVPDSIRSLGAGFVVSASGIGAFLGSLLLSVTNRITSRNGKNPWVDDIISIGHADYYDWLMAILGAIDLTAFLYFAHNYKYKVENESHMRGSLVTRAATRAKNNNNELHNLATTHQSEPTATSI